jgi:hypothetical protein
MAESLHYRAPRSDELPRVMCWLAVIGIVVAVERVLSGSAGIWWYLDLWGPVVSVDVVLSSGEVALGLALLFFSAAFLQGKPFGWLIALVEKFYLLVLGAWAIWIVGGNIRAELPPLSFATAADSLASADWLSSMVLAAVYPVFALVLLSPEQGEREEGASDAPV